MSVHFLGTPGPWRAAPWSSHAPTSILSDAPVPETIGGLKTLPPPTCVAECNTAGYFNDIANAALIAQAPAMLEALTELLDAIRTNVPGRDVSEPARPPTADEIFARSHKAILILEALRAGGAL